MKKSFKKFGVIVLALAMVFALTVPAMAADNELPNSGKVSVTSGGTVTFEKTIILFNDESKKIYEPSIMYTYTLTSVAAGANTTVTDADGHTAHVYAGTVDVTGPNSVVTSNTASATFAPSELKDAAAAGSQDTKKVSFEFNAEKFPHAGIFRFTIAESAGADTSTGLLAAGIERPTEYVASKNLDVYVKNTDSGLQIYGFVMFDNADPANDSLNPEKEAGKTNGEKSSGFTPGGPSNPNTDPTDFTNDTYCDHYKTINLTVEKKVTGLGDKTNEFPFTYTLTLPSAIKAAVKYRYNQTGAAADTPVDIAANASGGAASTIGSATASSVLNLKDGENFQIIGVPYGTSFSVNEYNNTVDTYKTTAVGTDVALTAGGSEQNFAASNALTTAIAGAESGTTWNTTANKITVTNDLPEISITGVAFRVAPYAAIGAAGFLFLAISKKSKKEEEEE